MKKKHQPDVVTKRIPLPSVVLNGDDIKVIREYMHERVDRLMEERLGKELYVRDRITFEFDFVLKDISRVWKFEEEG